MTRIPARWERAVLLFGQTVGTVAIVIMMVQVSVNGVLRRLAGVQIPFTLELTQWWYMPVIAATGIAIAAVQGEHFYVDLVFERLSLAGRRVLAIFAGLVTLALTLAITWFSLVGALDEAAVGRYEPVTGLVTWPFYFLVPLAFLAFSAVLVATIVRLLRGRLSELAERQTDEDAMEAVQ